MSATRDAFKKVRIDYGQVKKKRELWDHELDQCESIANDLLSGMESRFIKAATMHLGVMAENIALKKKIDDLEYKLAIKKPHK
jgi:hypothetical protein